MTTAPLPGPAAPGAGTSASEAPDAAPEAFESTLEVDLVPTYSLLARVSAEAFGTFVLVLLGVGTALFASVNGVAAGIGVPLGFGIGLLGAASAVGRLSGGHFNPAVTFGAAIARRVSWNDLVPYWFAQLVGGVGAALVLWLLVPPTLPGVFAGAGILTSDSVSELFATTANGYGVHSPLAGLTSGATQFGLAQVLLVEVVATAVLVGVFLGITDRRVNLSWAPVAFGLTFAVLLMFTTPMTNGSLNPARATAAAVFASSWALGQLWVFWVAPLVGGAIAALVYRVANPQPLPGGDWPQESAELSAEQDPDPEAVGVLATTSGPTPLLRQQERHALDAEIEADEIDALLAQRAQAAPADDDADGRADDDGSADDDADQDGASVGVAEATGEAGTAVVPDEAERATDEAEPATSDDPDADSPEAPRP